MSDLRQAAQALLDRWDSPFWKNGLTADAIADLRAALEQQQAEPVAQSDLVKRLRETASKGVSVWGNLQMEAAREIEILRAERDCYASAMDKMLAASRAKPVAFVNALEEAIHAAWSAGYVEGEKATLEQKAEPAAWMDREGDLYKMPEIPNWAPPHTMLYTAPPQQQSEPTSTTYTLDSTKAAVVATEFYWLPIDQNTPRGVKILLLGRGGVASLGHYHHKPGESEFWTHWAPLPKKP